MFGVRYELQFDDATPLDIALCRFVSLHGFVFKHRRFIHACENKVAKLSVPAVEGSHVPANANINQC